MKWRSIPDTSYAGTAEKYTGKNPDTKTEIIIKKYHGSGISKSFRATAPSKYRAPGENIAAALLLR